MVARDTPKNNIKSKFPTRKCVSTRGSGFYSQNENRASSFLTREIVGALFDDEKPFAAPLDEVGADGPVLR